LGIPVGHLISSFLEHLRCCSLVVNQTTQYATPVRTTKTVEATMKVPKVSSSHKFMGWKIAFSLPSSHIRRKTKML